MSQIGKGSETKITIVGQSSSGKTNMLASLMFNKYASEDVKEGPGGVDRPTFSQREPDDMARNYAEDLQAHYTRMSFGKDQFRGEGTNDVRSYSCRMQYTPPEPPVQKKSFWGGSRTVEPQEVTLDFDVIDGRGGDIAPNVRDEELDKTAKSRRQAYRDALDDSIAQVICMPIQKDAFKGEIVARFLKELEQALERKKRDSNLPRLARVAICYMMYEAEFVDYGADAITYASQVDVFRKKMMSHASLTMFNNFVLANRGEDAFDIRFFPVSAYGFSGETGGANFYRYPYAPGLKTRAIDELNDYDDPDLPDYRTHFPIPTSEGEAAPLWWPYNVAPPFLYALTGRITGPLSLGPEQLGFFGEAPA